MLRKALRRGGSVCPLSTCMRRLVDFILLHSFVHSELHSIQDLSCCGSASGERECETRWRERAPFSSNACCEEHQQYEQQQRR